MKFKIDENLPVEVAAWLRKEKYDSATVMEEDLGGQSDADIASICQKEERILVTLDTDFADIRTYPPHEFPGFIVLRLERQDKDHVIGVIDNLVKALLSETPERNLWIVEQDRIRIRG